MEAKIEHMYNLKVLNAEKRDSMIFNCGTTGT